MTLRDWMNVGRRAHGLIEIADYSLPGDSPIGEATNPWVIASSNDKNELAALHGACTVASGWRANLVESENHRFARGKAYVLWRERPPSVTVDRLRAVANDCLAGIKIGMKLANSR